MLSKDAATGIKIGYIFAWAFIASYYFIWGANEAAEGVEYTDESGWVPDGAYAKSMVARTERDAILEGD